ncbi:MAG: hypothetical protein KY459_15085 [Acidobacteria bacterium]|nr:hypothetical protein [Acidobacteriota bacterium]
MKLDHPQLVRSLQTAYSAEKAASLAYVGHAASLRDPLEKAAVRRIEQDEWDHRENVLRIMARYDVPISRWLEIKYELIGRTIGLACHVIGRFMPYYFAGRLESGNVCEYYIMIRYFHDLGIEAHDEILHEMGLREKEHEVHFLEMVRNDRWLPLFENVFSWGAQRSRNDVDLDEPLAAGVSERYCPTFRSRKSKQK